MRKILLFLLLIVFAPAAIEAQEVRQYTCPMHPHYIADEPGTCPICGMDLVPVDTGTTTEVGTKGVAASGTGEREKDSVATARPARAAVTIAPETIQNMGVRTLPAEMTVFGRTVRAFGAVTENTRLQTVVSGRVEGWIEDLAVTAVGDRVRKGDLLFRLYSPDLVAAQQDYLAALRRGVQGRIASSARRLESLGVQARSIEALRKSRKAKQRMPFYAGHDGVVARLDVREGGFVKPGEKILVVQDYSSVWVTASVAEKDLAMLREGVPAGLHFPSLPGQEIAGRVDYVHPTVDPQSRTGQVRLVLDNPQGALRPGAYADVVFNVEKQKRLAVPSEAILRDSQGAYIVKALGGGRFQPQRIETGITSQGRTEILSGVKMGEEIVVSGQFLIDSESALRDSLRKLQGTQAALALLDLSPAELSLLNHYVDAALYIHERLSAGQDITPAHLEAALQAGKKLKPRLGKTRLGPLLDQATGSVRAAQEARSRRELTDALAELTNALKPWLLEGKPAYYKQKGLKLAADHRTGRLWLQQGGKLHNPYGGGAHEVPWPEETPRPVESPERKSTPERPGGSHEHH